MTSVSKTALIWVPSGYAKKLQEQFNELQKLSVDLREVFCEDILDAMQNRIKVLKKAK